MIDLKKNRLAISHYAVKGCHCCPTRHTTEECFDCIFQDRMCDQVRHVQTMMEEEIIPPCFIGQPVYCTWGGTSRIPPEFMEGRVSMITQKADKSYSIRATFPHSHQYTFTLDRIGKDYFFDKQDANFEFTKQHVMWSEDQWAKAAKVKTDEEFF